MNEIDEIRNIRKRFAFDMLSVSQRGPMYHGQPNTLSSLAAFYYGYILAIDQVGGRVLHEMDASFCKFMSAKLGTNSPIHPWQVVFDKLDTEDSKQLKLFYNYWTDFCVDFGLIEKFDGGVIAK